MGGSSTERLCDPNSSSSSEDKSSREGESNNPDAISSSGYSSVTGGDSTMTTERRLSNATGAEREVIKMDDTVKFTAPDGGMRVSV
jgi:hypothetical protein